jgi:hypothetical protein
MKIIAYLERPARDLADIRTADVVKRVDGRCILGFEVGWLATLVHNIAVAGAMCRAFTLGSKYADDLWDVDMIGKHWRPGCGRTAP